MCARKGLLLMMSFSPAQLRFGASFKLNNHNNLPVAQYQALCELAQARDAVADQVKAIADEKDPIDIAITVSADKTEATLQTTANGYAEALKTAGQTAQAFVDNLIATAQTMATTLKTPQEKGDELFKDLLQLGSKCLGQNPVITPGQYPGQVTFQFGNAEIKVQKCHWGDNKFSYTLTPKNVNPLMDSAEISLAVRQETPLLLEAMTTQIPASSKGRILPVEHVFSYYGQSKNELTLPDALGGKNGKPHPDVTERSKTVANLFLQALQQMEILAPEALACDTSRYSGGLESGGGGGLEVMGGGFELGGRNGL